MKVSLAKSIEDIEAIRPLIKTWIDSSNREYFSLTIDIDIVLADLMNLVDSESSDLLLLKKEKETIGFMGITKFKSPLCNDDIANEHYWFVNEEHRGKGSLKLLAMAQSWAKVKSCSHLIMNASNLASGMHDKVCSFYERVGMKKFETSYIQEVT